MTTSPKRSKLITVLAAVVLICGLAGTASAALVATDLNSGGTDTGFSDASDPYLDGWQGSSNIRMTSPGDLTYANYFITQSGTPGNVYSGNTASTDRMDSRNMAAAMSNEVWFTFLVNVPAAGNWTGLSFDSNLTTGGAERYSHASSELRVLLSSSALLVDMNGGTPPTATGTETGTFAAATTHLVLGYMNLVSGNDTLSVWVDPDLTAVSVPADLPGAHFTSTTVDFADSIARIGVPNSDSTASDAVHVDAIWLSDTASAFYDVTGVAEPDTTPPTSTALSPTNGASGVFVASDLVISFDEDVAKGTNGNIVIQQTAGGTFETIAVTSTAVTVSGTNVTINPTGNLAGTTGYYIEIDSGAITDVAAASNAFAGIIGNGTWAFTTEALDTTAPEIAALSPTNGATGIVSDANLVITFDEVVQKGTTGDIVIQQTAGGTFETIAVTSTAVTVSSSNVTINPTGMLGGLTGYYVEIDAGAITDTAATPNDFAGISGSGTWSFTTEVLDVAAPDIATLSPTNGATGVAFDTELVISFDEAIQKGASGNIVIQQSAGGTFETIAITSPNVTVSDTNVTISLSSNLVKGVSYYVEIDAGAITDLAPTPNDFAGISGSSTWSFNVADGAFVATDINTGGTDTGFSGGWYAGSNNAFPTDTNDLTYADYFITQTGTTERVYASDSGGDRQDLRDLSTAMSGDIWFSVLVHVPTGGNFAALSFNHGSPNYDSTKSAARVWMTASQVQVGFAGAGATAGTGTFAADTTHLILGQMDVVSGNDTISVWVDPDLTAVSGAGGLPAANYTSTAVNFAASITSIGAGGNSGSAAEVHVDAIRLSDTASAFYDVTGVAEPDTTAPISTALSPTNGASGVFVASDLVISFDEDVAKGSTGNIVIQQTAGGTFETIAITSTAVTVSSSNVTINPTGNLAGTTGYYVEIDSGAITDVAAASNAFAGISGNGTWAFTTEALDTTAPDIATVSPTHGATGVTVDADLVIAFDEVVQKGSSGDIIIQQTAGGTFETIAVTSTAVTVSGTNVTISPVGLFSGLTEYHVEIDAGAITDTAATPNDFAGISGSGTWSFTTEVLDVTAPDIATLSPTNGSSGVAADTDLVIAFDENVQKGASGNIVIQKSAGGTLETIAVTSPNISVSGTNVMISLSSDLVKGVSYYVEIDAGAITDLAPTPNDFAGISGSSTWSFQVKAGALVATDLNTGGIDTGFSGGWAGSSGVGITTAADLIYANYGITQSGTTARVYNHYPDHPDRQDERALATAMDGEIWFSVLVNIPAGGDFIGLSFNNNSGNAYAHVNSDLRVLMTPTQLQVSFDGGGMMAGASTFAAATTHLLLGQMNVVTGNDTLNVWVDPDLTAVSDPGDLPAAEFTSTTVDFADSIVEVGVPGDDAGITISLDAIWLSDRSTAFVDVTGASGPDVTAPTVSALSPTNGATSVAVDANLVITFDEDVQKGASGDIVIQQTAGGTFETIAVTSPSVTVSGADVTINAAGLLAGLTDYYVEIDTGAITDVAAAPNNFAGISGSGTWSFTTEVADVTAPSITALSPTNGATGAAGTTDLVIRFDEDVQKGASGSIVIKQSAGGTFETIAITSASVTVSGSNVTINPSGSFANGAGYYVEIAGGAITDLAPAPNDFAGISGSGTWSFSVADGAFVATDINSGGADSGFAGGWYAGSNNAFPTDTNDLSYANYRITQTGTTERVYASNSGGDRQDCRDLATAMSGNIWFSVLVHVPAGGNYAALSFNPTESSALFNYESYRAALRLWMTASEIQVGFANAAATAGSGTFAADTTHLLLGQMNVVGGNDTIKVWVDPDLTPSAFQTSNLPTPNFTSSAVDFADSIVRIGAGGNSGSAAEVHVDAIRMSNTATAFYDVTDANPDPTASVFLFR
jgi:large repetitive protein